LNATEVIQKCLKGRLIAKVRTIKVAKDGDSFWFPGAFAHLAFLIAMPVGAFNWLRLRQRADELKGKFKRCFLRFRFGKGLLFSRIFTLLFLGIGLVDAHRSLLSQYPCPALARYLQVIKLVVR
jgi:hypothetical protein